MEEKNVNIVNEMAEYLNVSQLKKLQEILLKNLSENEVQRKDISNEEYLGLFLDAKMIEDCSDRTIQYYRVTVAKLFKNVTTPVRRISTEEIRQYLVEYQKINNCNKVKMIWYMIMQRLICQDRQARNVSKRHFLIS